MENSVRTTSGLEMALAVWHRRKCPGLLVFVALLSLVTPVARSLPDIYESTATVLVEHQQTPVGLVGPSADGELETRLHTISERILSRTRLYELVTQFDLYPELRQRATPDAVAEQMRRDIQLQFNGVRQPTGLEATIAFSLSYRGRDPETVARVTNALAALYVEENARMREQQTAGTTEFLQAQLEDAKQQLATQERRMIAFKEHHIGDLPEQQVANLAALERLNEQVRVINNRRDELTKQTTGLSDASGDTVSARLARLQQELANLRTRDTDEHPDVVRVRNEIAGLERQLAAHGGGPGGPASQPIPGSPAESELATLRNEAQGLQSRIATYQQRIENAPLIEQELQQLSQDYAAAKDLYQSLLQRYEGAQLAERMDQRLQGEQFRILDPAVASLQPVGPHRFRLLLMGLMGSLAAAVGAALLAETVDTSFHTVDDVRAITTVPVLVSIPPIVTETDARRRRQQFRLATLGAALGVAALVGVSSHLARSSDVLIRLLMPVRF